MKLVALNETEVVAIEKNGAINLDIEHTKVISVEDDEPVELGWEYIKPSPLAIVKLPLFGDLKNDLLNRKKPVVYATDENGNAYIVENP